MSGYELLSYVKDARESLNKNTGFRRTGRYPKSKAKKVKENQEWRRQ